jgi:hypothetical protein
VTSWQQIEAEAPDLAARVRDRFAMGTNKTIATLRRDAAYAADPPHPPL